MSSNTVNIDPSWHTALQNEFDKDYFSHLKDFLVQEKKNKKIYPPGPKIFAAFDHTPFDKVKVVIIGQDPYHGPGQANGLAFSVAPGIPLPPSLKNIFKEIESELDIKMPTNGDLTAWADQGVLLLNAVLTVAHKSPASHQNKGWETFTDAVIKTLSEKKEGLIFLLWGSFARSKKALIDTSKHHVLEATHPSPFSAHNGFFGSQHFVKTNDILSKEGKKPINWQL